MAHDMAVAGIAEQLQGENGTKGQVLIRAICLSRSAGQCA
jgi:hypothetical protein